MAENMAEMNDRDAKIYEIGYLLVPELAEEAVAAEVGDLKALIIDTLDGNEISSDMPKPVDLAYVMEKRIGAKTERYSKGYFGWIKFELSDDKIAEVKNALEKNNKIIRSLIIKTVRENTMLVKKVMTRPSDSPVGRKIAGASGASVPAMSEEELDKTIEELVIE